jgi:hypothetical protein
VYWPYYLEIAGLLLLWESDFLAFWVELSKLGVQLLSNEGLEVISYVDKQTRENQSQFNHLGADSTLNPPASSPLRQRTVKHRAVS